MRPSETAQASDEALDTERDAVVQSDRAHFFGEVEGALERIVAVDTERDR